MKLSVWLDDKNGWRRPIQPNPDWASIPRVGDLVSVANCDSYIHDTTYVVEKVVWSSRDTLPRVDCVPAYSAKVHERKE